MTTRMRFLAGSAALATLGAAPDANNAQSLADFDAASSSTAPHKHLFAATRFDDAFVLTAMRNTLNAYRELGVPESRVFCVGVLYHHDVIAIAFDDAMWEKYAIPYGRRFPPSSPPGIDFASVYDGTAHGNPVLHAGGNGESSVESLVAGGSRFFVCNNALRNYASSVATELNGNPTEIYDELSRHLVDGATIVPAGVWAVHALQERHFTVLQTSV
jgi:intracellular sulfur oxidation DsrE/DsrF family protein